MKDWSTLPSDSFRIKVFLDTNILNYLLDETFPNLTSFIKKLTENEFVDVISSEYCLMELVGIRKREHYLRELYKELNDGKGGNANFSSLIKYRNSFSSELCDFCSIIKNIKGSVESDLQIIIKKNNVNFCQTFNREMLELAKEICLSTKISREDSIVIVSSVTSSAPQSQSTTIILSNDKEFCDSYKQEDFANMFDECSLRAPYIQSVKNIDDNQTNLADRTKVIPNTEMDAKVKSFILKYLLCNNVHQIGKIFKYKHPLPKEIIAFKANKKEVVTNGYYTILSKNLDFILNTQRVEVYHCNNPVSQDGFTATTKENLFSFKYPLDNIKTEMQSDLLQSLHENGHLVFVIN